MAILHDHADALFLFPLLSACVIGTVLFVKIRGDSKLFGCVWISVSSFVGDDSGTGSGTDVGPGTDVASSSVFCDSSSCTSMASAIVSFLPNLIL